MRNRFDQQVRLGVKLIEDTPVLQKSRDDVPALLKALLEIYKTPEYSEQIFAILEDTLVKGKKKTGRKGLTLWQVFVLAEFRLALSLDYDRLHFMVSTNSVLRQLLGIENDDTGFDRIEIGYQRIIDNVHLLDDTTLLKINDVVVRFGHAGVFKKKEVAVLSVKTDSFVVESNVHFPTDYNLLWDSSRKALDIIKWFKNAYPELKGWRKSCDWFKSLKNLSRAMGAASSCGGKDKQERIKTVAKKYSWSFDKGYWHKENKEFLSPKISQVVMPKKGKPNKAEHQEQQAPKFKKLRNKHSAVESNINELEHCALDRCPDKGFKSFKRYVAIAIVAYNLKRIGREMLKQEQEVLKKKKQKQRAKQVV